MDIATISQLVGSLGFPIACCVVHYTGNETDTAKNNASFFATTNTRQAGAHFFVDENDIYYSIRVKYPAHSVGTKNEKVVAKLFGKCTNYNSISVELCSNKGRFLSETLNNAELLIKQLMYLFDIPSERVVRHYDVTGKNALHGMGGAIITIVNGINLKHDF